MFPKHRYILFLVFILSRCMHLFAQQDSLCPETNAYRMFKQSGNYPGIFVYGKEQFTPLYPKVVSGNTVQSSVLCQCLLPIDNSFQVVPFIGGDPNDQYRNDDGSTQPIQLPFNFCFYGQTMNSLFINNNGNISFIAPYGTFTSNSFPDPTFIMIAPFWGDVDTRNALSGVVYYKVTPTYMVVRWKTVGYFNQYADKTNDFQLIITDGNDPILPAGNNVSFCYGDMQWTTGDASGGTNGFGGNPATVGVNRGNGVDYIQIGRFDQPGNLYDGPFGNPDQVSWLDNQTFYFNVCNNGSGNNLPPIVNSAEVCDTIYACIGDTIFINASFLSPEQSQNTSVTYSTTSTGLNILNNQTGNQALWSAEFIASAANLGVNTIVITGTDNGVPAASTNATVIVEVIPLPQITISYSPSSPQVSPATVQFTSVTPGAVSWLWNFGDGDTSGVQSPQHVFHGDSVFTIVLTATLYTGCSSSDTVTFEVIGGVPVVAPNVVTPNGDGVNDALVFEHLDLYARSRLKVYNRWGNVIYENVDYHNDWKPNVSDGVYYYEITGPFIYEPITGFFHVIRSGK